MRELVLVTGGGGSLSRTPGAGFIGSYIG